MSYTSEDWRNAIANLIQRTSKKSVSWTTSELFKGDAWTEVDRSFECAVNDKLFVVSETRRKHYLDEDVFVWNGGYDFSVFTGDKYDVALLASAPNDLHIIGNLFGAAAANFAHNSNVLGDLL